jgi:uncharacterized protein YkwD
MKKFLIPLFLPILFGFSNPEYNEKSIILYFEEIINEYRTSNNLHRISLDESIKNFSDERCNDITVDYSHKGFVEKVFNRGLKYNGAYENIVRFKTPTLTNKPNYQHFKEIINEKGETIVIELKELNYVKNEMATGIVSNYNIAKYCFLKWKYSKNHNESLLNPNIKRFYLSHRYDESKTLYFCFIALD